MGNSQSGSKKLEQSPPAKDKKVKWQETPVQVQGEEKKGRLEVPVEDYSFPFENVVFEGGGAKALAYCGAVRMLEELGMWNRIRRLAGVGRGALVAALLAVGYNSYQVERFLCQDLQTLSQDCRCGYCCLTPNMLRGYGWNSASRLQRWLGERLRDAADKADVTFLEVYNTFGKELCIVVTNINQRGVEFCHPKTTPDMPVRVALQMAFAVPGLHKPLKYKRAGVEDSFVDGGAVCSFPLHCYDGWWLSMKAQDNFLEKLNPLTDLPRHLFNGARFAAFNDKTLGLFTHADHEFDVLGPLMEDRNGFADGAKTPETYLARVREDKREACSDSLDQHTELAIALEAFLKVLKDHNLDKSKGLTRNDLHNILSKRTIPDDDIRILFGINGPADDIFKVLGAAKHDQVSLTDLIHHVDRRSLWLQTNYVAYRRRNLKNLTEYFTAVHDTIASGNKPTGLVKKDLDRMVGIDTHHVGCEDYELEREDVVFLVNQGKSATKEFLEYYIMKKLPPVSEEDQRRSFHREDLAEYIDDELSEIINTKDYMDDLSLIGQLLS